MKVQTIFVLVLLLVFGCQSKDSFDIGDYPSQFGEIPFDPEVDDESFQLCDANDLVHSRVSLSYEGGRGRIEEIAKGFFEKNGNTYAYNGYVLARFLVNCNGEVGRLRFEYLDGGFIEQSCPEGLATLVKEAIESLNQWTITVPANEGKDHSKYLNFKIKSGQIDAIIH